jgi:hypothetical protein
MRRALDYNSVLGVWIAVFAGHLVTAPGIFGGLPFTQGAGAMEQMGSYCGIRREQDRTTIFIAAYALPTKPIKQKTSENMCFQRLEVET